MINSWQKHESNMNWQRSLLMLLHSLGLNLTFAQILPVWNDMDMEWEAGCALVIHSVDKMLLVKII